MSNGRTEDYLVAPGPSTGTASGPARQDADSVREHATDLGLRREDFRRYTSHRVHRPLKLGLLTFVSSEELPPPVALNNALELFAAAEQLGYDYALVRVRHFQPYLSGPIALLAAASQRTSTLRLGTGVIPFHGEDPIRLAEEALTIDALSGGRLELGFAVTRLERGVHSSWVARGGERSDLWPRVDEFLDHVAGVPIPADPQTELPGVPAGSAIVVTPANPALRQRIWAGPGSLHSVRETAERNLKLLVSSLNTEDVGLRFEPAQYEQIALYRDLIRQLHPAREPEVAVSRNIFPLTGGADDDALRELGAFFGGRLHSDGLHRVNGALGGLTARYSHPAFGTPDEVIDFLRTDIALAAADDLTVLVPSKLGLEAQIRHLGTVAERIAPALR